MSGRWVSPTAAPALLLTAGLHNLSLEYKSRKLASPVQAVAGRLLEMRFNTASAAVVFTLRPALVVPLGAATTLAETLQRAFAEQFESAAGSERLAVMPIDVALATSPELKDCLTQSDCQRQLARENKAEYVLGNTSSRVATPRRRNSWQIEIALYRATIAAPASTASKVLRPCTLEQAASSLRESIDASLSEEPTADARSIELSQRAERR